MNKISKLTIFIIAIFCLLPISYAYDNVVYVWQRNWDDNVQESIRTLYNRTGYFAVLCGDLKVNNGKVIVDTVDIDWTALAETETSTTLVFRINAKAAKLFETDTIADISKSIKDAIAKIIQKAPEDEITGIQFDYDCPTAKLKGYKRFLEIIKSEFRKDSILRPDLEVSITALSTWLGSGDFKDLVKQTSFYVLQLHAFERPRTIDDADDIFFKNEAQGYVKSAIIINHPFYVSLPTYGYDVIFNSKGSFLGLRAEGQQFAYAKGSVHKRIMAQPNDILAFANRYLSKLDYQPFLGVYWFRMPVKADEFNWHMKTLLAVLEKRSPLVSVKAEVVVSKDGLCEVYLINDGEKNVSDQLKINISWVNEDVPFFDVVNNFNYIEKSEQNGIQITGAGIKAGEKVLVAWFRGVRDNSISISEVEIDKSLN